MKNPVSPLRRWALVVVGFVLLAHAASFTYVDHLASSNPDAPHYPVIAGDSEVYARLADSLIEHQGFDGSGFEKERHWPPGYPTFLAAAEWLSGGFYLAVLIQITLALVAVYLVYLMACRFLTPLWAAAPALLYGLDPNVVLANTVVLSDGLFSSVLVIAVYIAFFWQPEHSRILGNVRVSYIEAMRWGIVGLLLASLTLMRPIAQFLVPLAPLTLGLHLYSQGIREVRAYVVPLVVYAVVAFSLLAPWLSWVHERFGVYEVSHVGASNLLYYNARDFLAWKEMNAERLVPAILASRYRDDLAYERVDAQIRTLLVSITPEGERADNYEGQLATRLILEDPLRYTYFHIVNTAPFFLGSSLAAYQQVLTQVGKSEGFYAPTMLALVESARSLASGSLEGLSRTLPVAVEIVLWALMFCLALVALWKGRRDLAVLIFGALVAYFAILTGPVAIVRYRIPAEPYLLILAFIGTRMVYERIRYGRNRR